MCAVVVFFVCVCVRVRAFVRACVCVCRRLVKVGRLEVGVEVEERGRLYTYRYTVTTRITIYFTDPSGKHKKIATREGKAWQADCFIEGRTEALLTLSLHCLSRRHSENVQ